MPSASSLGLIMLRRHKRTMISGGKYPTMAGKFGFLLHDYRSSIIQKSLAPNMSMYWDISIATGDVYYIQLVGARCTQMYIQILLDCRLLARNFRNPPDGKRHCLGWPGWSVVSFQDAEPVASGKRLHNYRISPCLHILPSKTTNGHFQ